MGGSELGTDTRRTSPAETSTQTANRFFEEVHSATSQRDREDITKDRQAVSDDQTGIRASLAATNVNNEIIRALLQNGRVPEALITRARQVHTQAMRDYNTDLSGSQEYAGTRPVNEQAMDEHRQQARSIGTLARELGNNPTPERRAAILGEIAQNAASISVLGQGNPQELGRDRVDAADAARNISMDVERLARVDSRSPLGRQLIADIASKSRLIQNDLQDIGIEQRYINADRSGTASSQGVLAALDDLSRRGRMPWASTEQYIRLFQSDNALQREIRGARREDIRNEGRYVADDQRDIRINQSLMREIRRSPY